MKLLTYPLYATNDNSRYAFVSVGPKVLLNQQILFALLHNSGAYNLAFGGYKLATQLLDDQAVRKTVANLANVGATLAAFRAEALRPAGESCST